MFTTHFPNLLVIATYLLMDIVLLAIITRVYYDIVEDPCTYNRIVMVFLIVFLSLGYFRFISLYYKDMIIIDSLSRAMLALSPEIVVIFIMLAPYLLKKAPLVMSVLNKNELIHWLLK